MACLLWQEWRICGQCGATDAGKSLGCGVSSGVDSEGSPVLWEMGGWVRRIPSLVFKSWEPSLNLEQKDSAILCAFRPWVPAAEEPCLTLL